MSERDPLSPLGQAALNYARAKWPILESARDSLNLSVILDSRRSQLLASVYPGKGVSARVVSIHPPKTLGAARLMPKIEAHGFQNWKNLPNMPGNSLGGPPKTLPPRTVEMFSSLGVVRFFLLTRC
jgi:hypothetical protein